MKKKSLYEKHIKRPLDLVTALVALVISSPFFLILTPLVYFKLGSPVIFKQERPGLKAQPFTLTKFRTMTNEVDEKGQLLSNEDRLTSFGNFLRASSLDELPELFNIVKGEMSFVGPRPLLSEYLPLYNDFQKRRHEVRPGLTGLAQVKGRNALSWEDKFRYDVEYVDNISFLGDMKIILLTIKTIFSREGIDYQGQAKTNKFTGEEDQ